MTHSIIFQTQDEHGSIQVRDIDGIRSLHFNSEPQQSAMQLKYPDQLHLHYAQAMLSFLLFKELKDDDLLLIGLGGGSVAKYLLNELPDSRIEAIEFRQAVAQIAHDYFALPHSPRLNVVIDDGARYVRERLALQQQFFSVILLDAFDATGMAQELCCPEFFMACQKLLKRDGILVVDLWNSKEQFEQLISWIGSLFNAKLLFLPVHGMINVIGLFFHEATPMYDYKILKKRAIALEKKTQLPFKKFLKDLMDFNPNFVDRVIQRDA